MELSGVEKPRRPESPLDTPQTGHEDGRIATTRSRGAPAGQDLPDPVTTRGGLMAEDESKGNASKVPHLRVHRSCSRTHAASASW